VSIPYQDTTLPGYLFLVDDSGAPRPTIICTTGYDSTSQECYFVLAVAAMRRGYNVLAFDGPGQGGALHLQKLVMRPDWEAVITPVVDYALTRPEIQPDRIAGFGYSLGGYLLARAAAFEHRLAGEAVLLDGRRPVLAVLSRISTAFRRPRHPDHGVGASCAVPTPCCLWTWRSWVTPTKNLTQVRGGAPPTNGKRPSGATEGRLELP